MHDIKTSIPFEITRRAMVLAPLLPRFCPLPPSHRPLITIPKAASICRFRPDGVRHPIAKPTRSSFGMGTAQAIVAVIQQNKSNAMTAKEFVGCDCDRV